MVLLILAVIWAVVLVPPVLRSRAEGRPADSIGDFRRRLTVLERTGPTLLSPAHRLGARRVERFAGPVAFRGPTTPADLRRSRTLKRRRDVLVGLLVCMGGTLVLGAIPSLRVLWAFHLVLDVAFGAYVFLLIRMRNAAAERSMKLRVISGGAVRGMAQAEPTFALQRSVNG